MIDALLQLDYEWFTLVNSNAQNGFLDLLCPFMRTQSNWYLAYAVLIYFLFNQYGKKTWWLLITVAITILVSDQISGNLIKNSVERIRPCNDPRWTDQMRLLVHCGKGYSFVSSHAANHFAAAFFIGASFGKLYRWIWPTVILWASLISFSQVYVGVHYPLDVIFGAALGIIIGIINLYITRKILAAQPS